MNKLIPSLAVAALALSPVQASASVGPDRTVFNNPNSSTSAAYQMMYEFRKLVAGAPKGSLASGSVFSIDIPWVYEEIARAHKRGVNVQIVMRGEGKNRYTEALRKLFKKDYVKGQGSWLVYCQGACTRGGSIGTHHSKVWTLSSTRGVRYVTFIGSNNLTKSGAERSWGTAQIIGNNACVYNPLRKFIYDMRKDTTIARSSKPVTCGRYRIWMMGRIIATHPIYSIAKNMRITKGCEVYVPMFIWRDEEARTAARLGQLYNKGKGCKVGVIIDGATTTKKVKETLKRYKVPTWEGRGKNVYPHTKGGTFIGKIYGKQTAVSIGGSANLTKSAQGWGGKLPRNDDLVIADYNKSTAEAHKKQSFVMTKYMKKYNW